MSTDDNDFLAACAMAAFGCGPALLPVSRVVVIADDFTPSSGHTEP